MEFFARIATVIRILPPRTALLWWDGKPNQELLTFDDAGYKLIFNSLGGSEGMVEDVVRNNIKLFLNDLLATTKYDFDKDGPILLDEPKAKRILQIR
ncbi:MAG TPA: hypothetical protein VGL22_14520 [Terracidiphilus sp.]|jgi:hypothetical protein